MRKTDDKYTVSINNLGLQDAGLYQVDVEDTNIFSTDLTSKSFHFTAACRDGQRLYFNCCSKNKEASLRCPMQ